MMDQNTTDRFCHFIDKLFCNMYQARKDGLIISHNWNLITVVAGKAGSFRWTRANKNINNIHPLSLFLLNRVFSASPRASSYEYRAISSIVGLSLEAIAAFDHGFSRMNSYSNNEYESISYSIGIHMLNRLFGDNRRYSIDLHRVFINQMEDNFKKYSKNF